MKQLSRILKQVKNLNNPLIIALVACIAAIIIYSLLQIVLPYRNYESGLVIAVIISLILGYTLGQLVIPFNRTLKKQLDINRDNNETLGQLIHILSHDIKGPLANIRQIIDLLRNDNISNEEMGKLFNQLDEDTGRTLKLTNNLVGWIKTQNQNYTPSYKAENIEHLVSQTIDLYKSAAEYKGVEIKHDKNEDLSFATDKEMYKISLRNLISNAVKYTNKGGFVKVSYEINAKDELVTYVKDNGVGIKPEVMTSLLSSDQLIESSLGTNEEKGTGIGLHLSKSIINKLNGEFYLESIYGKGSCFYFSLPSKHKPV